MPTRKKTQAPEPRFPILGIGASAGGLEAMASHRPFRAALGIDLAMEEIQVKSSRGAEVGGTFGEVRRAILRFTALAVLVWTVPLCCNRSRNGHWPLWGLGR